MLILSIIVQIKASFYIRNISSNNYLGLTNVKEDLKMVNSTANAQKVKVLFFAPTKYFKIEKQDLLNSYLTNANDKLQFNTRKYEKGVTNDLVKDVTGNNEVFELIDTTTKARIVAIKQNNFCLAEKNNVLYMEECADDYNNQLFELVAADDDTRTKNEEIGKGDHLFVPDRYDEAKKRFRPNKLFRPATHLKEVEKDVPINENAEKGGVTQDLRPKDQSKPDTTTKYPESDYNIDFKKLMQDIKKYLIGKKPNITGKNDFDKEMIESDPSKDIEAQIKEDEKALDDGFIDYIQNQKPDDIDYFSDAFHKYIQDNGDDMCKLVFDIGLKFLRYAKDRLLAKKISTMPKDNTRMRKENDLNRDLFFGDKMLQSINPTLITL